MAKLILREGGAVEKEVLLDDSGSITIGRSPDCELEIHDTQASRRHCSVVRLQSGYEVADLGSTNGTLLNSTLVKRKKLRHGDVIRIGNAEIAFDDPDSEGASGEMENCFLVYARGDRKGERFELVQQRTTMGRKETNAIVLQDPVASSYHCEIVRDLNGYTIRDLGSTNGTLVNNEMITEAQLMHGARIRIGNTRLVFQDPAMAEIDLELAGVDDDEQEWGMMRDLDLAAVRKRNPATILYTLVFLALLGGGYFYITNLAPRGGQQGPTGPDRNEHEPYSFESQASAFSWYAEPAGSVDMRVTAAAKVSGKSSLELRSELDEAEAFYGEELPGRGKRFKLTAQVAAPGDAKVRIGLLWRGVGLQNWVLSDEIAGSGFTPVELVASAPPWTTTVRLGVRIEGKGIVRLDDVALVPAGNAQPKVIEQNQFRLTITDGRAADLSHAGIPVLAAGELLARDANGRDLDPSGLTLEAEAVDEQHTLVTVNAKNAPDGTARVGIAFREVAGYLTNRGGFRAFGSEDTGFPTEGRRILKGVRKLLIGPAGRSLSVIAGNGSPGEGAQETGTGTLTHEAEVAGRKRIWRVLGEPIDGVFSFLLKTDLRGETALVNKRQSEADTLYNAGRWGEFVTVANETLAEFPFAPKRMRTRLQKRVQGIGNEYAKLAKEADRLLRDYDEFKDMASLVLVRRITDDLQGRFQIKPGEGPRGKELARVLEAERTRRAAAERQQQEVLAGPVFDLAKYVAVPNGEVHSAAVLLFHIIRYLPESPQAAEAKVELEKLEKDYPHVLRVLERIAQPEN